MEKIKQILNGITTFIYWLLIVAIIGYIFSIARFIWCSTPINEMKERRRLRKEERKANKKAKKAEKSA